MQIITKTEICHPKRHNWHSSATKHGPILGWEAVCASRYTQQPKLFGKSHGSALRPCQVGFLPVHRRVAPFEISVPSLEIQPLPACCRTYIVTVWCGHKLVSQTEQNPGRRWLSFSTNYPYILRIHG